MKSAKVSWWLIALVAFLAIFFMPPISIVLKHMTGWEFFDGLDDYVCGILVGWLIFHPRSPMSYPEE